MATVKIKVELFKSYLKSYRVDGHPYQLASRVDIDEIKSRVGVIRVHKVIRTVLLNKENMFL